MAEVNTVADGFVKFRDGKKWKLRWCAVRMPSPVADRLQVYLYKGCKDTMKTSNAKSTFPLEGFYGIESGFFYEKECNVMAIICQKQVIMMAFETRELMIHFELRIRRSLGEEHQYPVRILKVPPGSKLPLENARMHIHDSKFCFTAYIPPKMLQSWQISELRRFGLVESKFAFEGGSRCGKGAGVHVIATDQGEEVAEIFQAASEGKTSSNNRKCLITKRRSQINDFSESAFKQSYFKDSSNPTCSAEMDLRTTDYEWQKRHSISATDYGCAEGYMEKTKLISIENLENEGREHFLAIYDIPPRRLRKVECTSPNRNSLQSQSKNISYLERHPSNGSLTCDSDKNSLLKTKKDQTPSSDCFSPPRSTIITSNVNSASEESASPSYLTNSAIDYEIDRATNKTRRDDAHNKLHREEEKLQREISLLDEMLQVCQLEETKPGTGESKSKFIVSMHTKLPSPSKKFSMTNMWIDSKPPTQQMAQSCNHICSLNNNVTSKRSSTGFWESGMGSPNFLPKLNKIPQNFGAPLPYVNLERYDVGDDCSNIPISNNGSSAENLLEINANCSNYDNLSPEFGQSKPKLDYQNNSSLNLNENVNRTEKIDVRSKDLNLDNLSPPKLPPKGPVLQNKNSQRYLTSCLEAFSTSPILKPSRRHTMSPDSSSSSDLSPYHVPKISHPLVVRMRDHEMKDPTEPYLLMGGFAKEEKPLRDDIHVASGYMDMTGKFEIPSSQPPPACLPIQPVTSFSPNISPMNQCPPPPPLNTMPNDMWLQSGHSGHCEENYMEMGGSSKFPFCKDFLNPLPLVSAANNDSNGSKVDSSINESNPIPFPNLKNFQSLNSDKSAESSLNSSPTKLVGKEKSQENAGKSPGFFSRLIRRNSKDHAKNCQSQENLSASTCSLERSNSIQDNICRVNNVEITGNVESVQAECHHLSIERQRSSSFPSEHCFHDMTSEGPKCKAGHNVLMFSRLPGSFSITNQMGNQPISPTGICNHNLPFQKMCNNHSSCQSNRKKKTNLANDFQSHVNNSSIDIPCENNPSTRQVITRTSEHDENENDQKENLSDSYIYMGPLCKEEKEEMMDDNLSYESIAKDTTINVSCVQDDFMVHFRRRDSSKTDDEKLLELYQSCKSNKHKEDEEIGSPVDFPIGESKDKCTLPLSNKLISPDEQAAEIARHVADLPPFIPPKTKTYPCSLSPVFESNNFLLGDVGVTTKVNCENELNHNPTEILQPPFQLKDLSDYVQQKQQVQSSLRIAPASDTTHDSIWILRDTDSTGERQ